MSASSSFAINPEDDSNIYYLKSAPAKEAVYVASAYSALFIHELGHAVTPFLFFGHPTVFKPWPHRRNGQITLGWVQWRGPGVFFPTVNPFIQFMGVGFNMAAAYFGAYLIPKASNIYLREYYIGTAYANAVYFPFYLITDLIFGNKNSDFGGIKKQTGIGRGWFIIPALASSAYLVWRIIKFEKRKPHDRVIDHSVPKTGFIGHSSLRTPELNFATQAANPLKFSFTYDPSTHLTGIMVHKDL